MSVDYRGNYGIGIQVVRQEFEEGHEYYEDFLGWLDEQLDGYAYDYFEVGESTYVGGEDEIYVSFKDPFRNGYDLEASVDELLAFLKINKIEYIGKVDVVGGLRIS